MLPQVPSSKPNLCRVPPSEPKSTKPPYHTRGLATNATCPADPTRPARPQGSSAARSRLAHLAAARPPHALRPRPLTHHRRRRRLTAASRCGAPAARAPWRPLRAPHSLCSAGTGAGRHRQAPGCCPLWPMGGCLSPHCPSGAARSGARVRPLRCPIGWAHASQLPAAFARRCCSLCRPRVSSRLWSGRTERQCRLAAVQTGSLSAEPSSSPRPLRLK